MSGKSWPHWMRSWLTGRRARKWAPIPPTTPAARSTSSTVPRAGNYAYGGDSILAAPFTAGTPGSGYGGALFNLDGSVTLSSDTLVGNHAYSGMGDNGSTADGNGAEIYNLAFGKVLDTLLPPSAALTLHNSIIATTGDTGSNLVSQAKSGTASVDGSWNLVMSSSGDIPPGVITLTADPRLGPLQYNGSLMQTLMPSPGSPVLGAGDPGYIVGPYLTNDQNGVPRPPNGPIDLGSVQVSVAPQPNPAPVPPSPELTQTQTPAQTPPPPLQAIVDLYIAELEKVLHIGDPFAVQNAIDFDSQYSVIFGINIAPFIEQMADSLVQATLSGHGS